MTPEMKQQIDKYWDEDKHDKIVQMIMAVQCSGAGEALELVCAACVTIQNDNSFYDWHNH